MGAPTAKNKVHKKTDKEVFATAAPPKQSEPSKKKAKTAAFLQDLAEDQDKLYGELNTSETPSEHCFRTSC